MADKPISVLLVDDETDFSEPIAFWLKSRGYEVKTLQNGKEAVSWVKDNPPDIMFMDINMPVMDGIEATRQIRTAWPAVRVIGLSMFNSTEYAAIMKEAGAAAYLVKASAADLLVAVIRECNNPNA